MLKKFSFILLAIGLLLVATWGGIQLFGDNVVSEIKKSQAETIQVPSSDDVTAKSVTPQVKDVKRYTIHISNEGGDVEMDYCASGFTEMIHYEGLNDKRLLSQHNNCGGDIVLPMELGDHVVIEGDQEYVITELRDTTKQITTAAINDMNGDVLLQSCYYKDNKMKFVALTPVNKTVTGK